MRQKSEGQGTSEQVVKDICWVTRKQYSAEEQIMRARKAAFDGRPYAVLSPLSGR